MKLLLAAVLGFLLTGKDFETRIYAKDAAKYIGQYVRADGRLYSAKMTGPKTAILYLGCSDYPNNCLTVILNDISDIKANLPLFTKTILAKQPMYARVNGNVVLINKKPAIIVNDADKRHFLDFKDVPPSPDFQ